jgi:DNA-binding GntR family transcriptional regulator
MTMDQVVSLPRISRARLNDSIYEVVKEKILSQELAPGQRLDLEGLTEQLGVSMTPLKDALNHLSVEGLIEIVPRRGTYVTDIKRSEVAETFDVRCALEACAVRLFLEKASDAELHEIATMVDKLDELAGISDKISIYQQYVNIDREMHHRIVELTRNQRLLKAHESEHAHMYMARTRYGSFEESLDEAQEEHRHLRDAILARDIPLAQAVMQEHIQRAKNSLLGEINEVQS